MSGAAWDEIAGGLGAKIADDLRAMALAYDARADRSQQTALGPSEIGNPCTYHLGRKILGLPEDSSFDDPWCRIIGTATHTWLEEAAALDNHTAAGRWLHEIRVHPDPELLPAGGKCDLYDADRLVVIDHKIVGTASQKKYKANGPGRQYRAQAHLYGKGHRLEGKPVEHVAIAFWLRGGRLTDLYVWTEPYDESIADAALERYRTLKGLLAAGGPAVLPQLPRDLACWDCRRNPQLFDVAPVVGNTTTRPDAA